MDLKTRKPQPKELKRPACFIVTPYGERHYGKNGRVRLDFDEIDRTLVEPAAEAAGFYPERCDESEMGGPITNTMIEKLQSSALVITDITGANPNAMYELGMRYAFAPYGTLLIRAQGMRKRGRKYELAWEDKTPFNIKDLPYFIYEFDVKTGEALTEPDALEHCIRGLRANRRNDCDSPVYSALPDFRAERRPKALDPGSQRRYQLIDRPDCCVGIRTGDILDIQDIDYWTNSENTQFMMARPYEQSLSASIRAAGGQFPDTPSDEDDLTDTIAEALQAHVGPRGSVNAGTVRTTTSGMLAGTHNVRAILHVASVRGTLGRGYHPVDDIPKCIRNLMRTAEDTARTHGEFGGGRSLLIPLIGTGTGRGQASQLGISIIETALEQWRDCADSVLKRIEFLAYTQKDLDVISRVLYALSNVQGNNHPLVEAVV